MHGPVVLVLKACRARLRLTPPPPDPINKEPLSRPMTPLHRIEERLRAVHGGDVIIAHMNKPRSDTAEGLSTGLLDILRRGLVFVRLDQVDLAMASIVVALPFVLPLVYFMMKRLSK